MLFVPFFLFESSSRVTVIFLQRLLLARAASPSIYRTLARNYRSFERRASDDRRRRVRSRLASLVLKGGGAEGACGEERVKLNVREATSPCTGYERAGLRRHCGFCSRHRSEKRCLARLLNWIRPYEGNAMTIRAKGAAGNFVIKKKGEIEER